MKQTTTVVFDHSNAVTSMGDAISTLISGFFEIIDTWRQRSKTRAQLAGMSAHIMRDTGITVSDVMIESNKPFWEA